jgi:3-oxoacyl-[acyl-carrier protein] reductase
VSHIEQAGGRASFVVGDVTNREDVANVVTHCEERYGGIDVLVNNAGRFHSIGGLHEVDPEDWWADVTVNLYGPMLMIRSILPGMLTRDRGVIINMDGGRPAGGSSYASSKAGLMELTEKLREQLEGMGSSVCVFAANPGLNHTDMTEFQRTSEEGQRWIPQVKRRLEAGQTREPKEIARVIASLVEAADPSISGIYVTPDSESPFGRESR